MIWYKGKIGQMLQVIRTGANKDRWLEIRANERMKADRWKWREIKNRCYYTYQGMKQEEMRDEKWYLRMDWVWGISKW